MPCERAIVTHLVALGEQTVRDVSAEGGGRIVRRFADGERLFVEQSRKFDLDAVERLGALSGMRVRRTWTDADEFTLIAEFTLAAAPAASPNVLAFPLSAAVVSSMTPHTGNAITARRLLSLLPAAAVAALDIHKIKTRPAMVEALAHVGAGVVLGVHAYRSGRLLLGSGVPYVIVLGGTDMNIDVHEPAKGAVIRRVVAEAAAVIPPAA